MDERISHQSVMVNEVLAMLSPDRGGVFVDCTVGAGGHAASILAASPQTKVVGVDRDEVAIQLATGRLGGYGSRFTAIRSNFKDLPGILAGAGIFGVDGILVDLGVSSIQLDDPGRGFSFRLQGPLDMRMDRRQSLTAEEIVNTYSAGELADLIYHYGEEPASRRIAREIVKARQTQPIRTTTQLAEVILRGTRGSGRWRIHPATRTFQALRIEVNKELQDLEPFLIEAVGSLNPDGRMVVITFHSLEDRVIKQTLRLQTGQCQCPPRSSDRGGWIPTPFDRGLQADQIGPCPGCGAHRLVEILTRKPIQPSEAEILANPRARSAKLRACRKLTEAEKKTRLERHQTRPSDTAETRG